MTPTEVSVVLPTRDRARTLARAVRSVLDQQPPVAELVVVDDGSTDDTARVLAGIDDPRLRVITLPGGGGAPAARNVGVAATTGRWVAFQDSDDEWLPGKVAAQLAAAARVGPRCGLVFSALVTTVQGEPRVVPAHGDGPWEGDVTARLVRGNMISLQTAMVRRDLLDAAGGFDESLRRLQEWDLWLRLPPGTLTAQAEGVGVRAEESADSITRSAALYLPALTAVVERHRDLLSRYGQLARWEVEIAVLNLLRRDLRPAARHLGLAVRSSPLRTLRALLALLRKLDPASLRRARGLVAWR